MFKILALILFFQSAAIASYEPTPTALSLGGTGQSTKAAAFDALQPMTTSGDIIYGGASGTGTRLAKGSDGQVLTLASGFPSWAAASGGTGGGDWVGSIKWVPTTNCSWSATSSATFASFSTDADCDDNSPAATGLVSLVNSGQSPAFAMTITDTTHYYEITVMGVFGTPTGGGECVGRFSDGTNHTDVGLVVDVNAGQGFWRGIYIPPSTGAKTINFQMTGMGASANCTINANASMRYFTIDVKRFTIAASL